MSLILFIMITTTKTASTLPQALDILSAQDEHIFYKHIICGKWLNNVYCKALAFFFCCIQKPCHQQL